MFELSTKEIETVVSQFVIPNRRKFGGAKPMAFTEQGVAMLSSVLNSERAVKVNIAIMRAFVKLRQTLETNRELAQKFSALEQRVGRHDEEISAILEAIRQLMAPPEKPHREIGFHVREKAAHYRTRKASIRHA
jgi:ORF6N domain